MRFLHFKLAYGKADVAIRRDAIVGYWQMDENVTIEMGGGNTFTITATFEEVRDAVENDE